MQLLGDNSVSRAASLRAILLPLVRVVRGLKFSVLAPTLLLVGVLSLLNRRLKRKAVLKLVALPVVRTFPCLLLIKLL